MLPVQVRPQCKTVFCPDTIDRGKMPDEVPIIVHDNGHFEGDNLVYTILLVK